MEKGQLSQLAKPCAEIAVRVTPRAARNAIETSENGLRVYVTAPPDGGKANAAVAKLLARALGIPKTGLHLLRGQAARDKIFRVL